MGLSATELAEAPVGAAEAPEGKKLAGRSPTQIAFDRLRKDKMAIVCTSSSRCMVLAAVLAPLDLQGPQHLSDRRSRCPTSRVTCSSSAAQQRHADQRPAQPRLLGGPPARVWRPTTGVDNLARLLYGLRTDLLIATVATVLSIGIGVVLGLVAGFSHGWLDRIIMFVTDLFLSFPFLLGALAMAPIIVERFGKPGTTSPGSTGCSSSP